VSEKIKYAHVRSGLFFYFPAVCMHLQTLTLSPSKTYFPLPHLSRNDTVSVEAAKIEPGAVINMIIALRGGGEKH